MSKIQYTKCNALNGMHVEDIEDIKNTCILVIVASVLRMCSSKSSEIHCTDFNALNGTHVKDVKDYRNICIVVSCINVEDVEDI